MRTRIETANGRIEFSREDSVPYEGVVYNAFARNSLIARVTHHATGNTWVVIFPVGWLSTNPTDDENLVTAAFGAGVAWARGESVVKVVER